MVKAPDTDHRVQLHGVTWDEYETILSIRGDAPGVRITYLEGELEFTSPSRSHELIKSMIGRLLELYLLVNKLRLEGCGTWTVRQRDRDRGAEADECYILTQGEHDRPDLAIEVVWTHGGIDKLETWRGLAVPEVWIWEAGQIRIFELRNDRFHERTGSGSLPDLDLEEMMSFVVLTNQTGAANAYFERLRGVDLITP